MTKTVAIKDFLRGPFRSFSTYDCNINIPSLIDGFKVSQRKAMWTVLNNPKQMTVEQLASLAASYTRYHHGATNLEGVIVGLAQDFTGSNNVNWLVPDGQFGNILSHASASPRYISTSLHANWKKWVRKEDDIILEYEIEDGEITEPKYFLPAVPTLLFNGSAGIGTGYSSKILSYNPADIIENVKRYIQGKEQEELIPYYNGYKGTITKVNGQTIYTGAYEKASATSIRITQLPIGYTLEQYKEVLIKLMDANEIKDYDDHSSENGWDIVIHTSREWVKQHHDIIIDKLKLVTKDSETITVWDENQRIRRFANPNQLIEHFVKWRLTKYEERRQKQIELLKADLVWLNEKRRFIQYFIDHSKELVALSKAELTERLNKEGFVEVERLLQIRIYNMTRDEITSLDEEILKVQGNIDALEKTTAKDMYLGELKQIKL